ncbi:MAG TPA: hypothetical protein VG965_05480 [Patescibacteria group bacterium]|nr:hypothetical protein [Patescibacteria group bacterium]
MFSDPLWFPHARVIKFDNSDKKNFIFYSAMIAILSLIALIYSYNHFTDGDTMGGFIFLAISIYLAFPFLFFFINKSGKKRTRLQ